MYQIIYKKSVEKDLRKIDTATQKQIVERVGILASEPRPDGAAKLRGEKDLYRIRLGDYRIIYQIIDSVLVVRIIKIGHRKEIYRTKL